MMHLVKNFEKGALVAPLNYKWLIEQLAKVFHDKNSVAKQKHFFWGLCHSMVCQWFLKKESNVGRNTVRIFMSGVNGKRESFRRIRGLTAIFFGLSFLLLQRIISSQRPNQLYVQFSGYRRSEVENDKLTYVRGKRNISWKWQEENAKKILMR